MLKYVKYKCVCVYCIVQYPVTYLDINRKLVMHADDAVLSLLTLLEPVHTRRE